MKLHPLHTYSQIADYMINTGEYFPLERGTGRTERRALNTVAHAMQYPHQWHRVMDHHPSRPAHKHLRVACQRIVERMGYRGFSFRDVEICFGEPPCQE